MLLFWYELFSKSLENNKGVRACIYPKDIQCITGRSEYYGRNLLNKIKEHFGKESYRFITSEEFVEYSEIKLEIVNDYLQKVL